MLKYRTKHDAVFTATIHFYVNIYLYALHVSFYCIYIHIFVPTVSLLLTIQSIVIVPTNYSIIGDATIIIYLAFGPSNTNCPRP